MTSNPETIEDLAIHLAGMLDQFTTGTLPPAYIRLPLTVSLRKLEAVVAIKLKELNDE